MLKLARFLLLAGGIALAAWLIGAHLGSVRAALAQVGWGILFYLAASSVAYLADAWGWHHAVARGGPRVPFWQLFCARMAGEAVSKITPLASMGGEPLKAYLLARSGTPMPDAISSVVVSKNTMTLAQIAFIFSGVALATSLLPHRAGGLIWFAAFPGAVLAAMIVTALLDLHLRRKRREQAESGGPEAPEGVKPRAGPVLEMWSRIADFFWANPRAALLSILCFFVGWAAGALELLAGAYLLRVPLSLAHALALEALLVSVNMASFFIPGNAGVQESGFAGIAPLLGLAAPHAVALAVLRRLRDVFWIAFGLLYMARTEGRLLFRPQAETPGSPTH